MDECGKKDTCKNYGKKCSQCWANSSIYDTHPCYTSKDFVEVVRCKNCIHKVDFKGRVMCDRNAKVICGEWCGLTATNDEHFCSYGTPKERGG